MTLRLLTHWAEPNAVDVVLLLPRPELARFPISAATRHELQRLHVQLQVGVIILRVRCDVA